MCGAENNVVDMEFGQLTQYRDGRPYYTWEIGGKNVPFRSEHEFINQESFRARCVRELYWLPTRVPNGTWTAIVNKALSEVKVVSLLQE